MVLNRGDFEQVAQRLGDIPFEQSLAWQEFKSTDKCILIHFVDNLQDPYIACWGRIFKRRGIGKVLDITGEIKKEEITQKQVTHFFESVITDAKCDMITYNSVSQYECIHDIGMRRAGFKRPLGNRTCPLSIFVDVQDVRNPDRIWKRNLKKNREANLEFEVVSTPSKQDVSIVCRIFDELKEMKSLSYRLNEADLYKLLMNNKFNLFYIRKDSRPLCARIVYINNGFAADVFAANSFESRNYSATYMMMENIFEYLKEEGVKTFDFSRIPPSSNETDSVYIFKKSSGGYPIQYNGEWIWCKRKILSLLFCIYNFYVRKAHQY